MGDGGRCTVDLGPCEQAGIVSETIYRLARDPGDYRRAQALAKVRGAYQGPLGFPTVLAERDGKVVGFVSTHPKADAVLCDRLAVAEEIEKPARVIFKLAEAYERVMWMAGIRAYYIWIENGNTELLPLVTRLYGEPYHVDAEHHWFRVDLGARKHDNAHLH
jgi:hypothetical protein